MRLRIKRKLFFLSIITICIYFLISYVHRDPLQKRRRGSQYKVHKSEMFLEIPNIFLHIDLKGAPPSLAYLKHTISEMVVFGVNGILIEYEDMFPYEGKLANLRSVSAYTRAELIDFLEHMTKIGLQIVPLIQTFGHLEFALKLPEFRDLRENDLYPDSICPSHPETKALLIEMIRQVIALHKEVTSLKYFHIGSDEVFHVQECNLCVASDLTPIELLLNHLKNTTKIVKTFLPRTKVLFWHDILLKNDPLLLNPVEIDAEPVAWAYQPHVKMQDINLFRYPPDIKNVWIASAFKGADGQASVIPNITNRLQNHFNLMQIILNYEQIFQKHSNTRKFNFRGIILSGWSRYSHMSPLCDLLSVSQTSAIACLLLINEFKQGVAEKELKEGFDIFYKARMDIAIVHYFQCNVLHPEESQYCSFIDFKFYSFLKLYTVTKKRIEDFYSNSETNLNGLDYYFDLGLVDHTTADIYYNTCKEFLDILEDMEEGVAMYMRNVYNNATIVEYVNFLTYHHKNKLMKTISAIENYRRAKTWERMTVEHYKLVDKTTPGA